VIKICETEPHIGAAFGMMLARKLATTLKGINSRLAVPNSPDPSASPNNNNDNNSNKNTPHSVKLSSEEVLTPSFLDSRRESEPGLESWSNHPHKLTEKKSFYMKGILTVKEEKKKIEKGSIIGGNSLPIGDLLNNRSPEDEKFQKIFSLDNEVVLRKFSCFHKKKKMQRVHCILLKTIFASMLLLLDLKLKRELKSLSLMKYKKWKEKNLAFSSTIIITKIRAYLHHFVM
jgi:hypothetical protein